MRLNRLGTTGLYVSELCLGTMTFGGGSGFFNNFGAQDQAEATAMVARALEAGVNLFDTADIYAEGASEGMLGQALRDLAVRREDVVIATKCFGLTEGHARPSPNHSGLSRRHIMLAAEASLKRLGLDHIDLSATHTTTGLVCALLPSVSKETWDKKG
jgi:aryl-alcohol dehydrogenase-like predicted oxidoreductase